MKRDQAAAKPTPGCSLSMGSWQTPIWNWAERGHQASSHGRPGNGPTGRPGRGTLSPGSTMVRRAHEGQEVVSHHAPDSSTAGGTAEGAIPPSQRQQRCSAVQLRVKLSVQLKPAAGLSCTGGHFRRRRVVFFQQPEAHGIRETASGDGTEPVRCTAEDRLGSNFTRRFNLFDALLESRLPALGKSTHPPC